MDIKVCLGTYLSLLLQYKASKRTTNRSIVGSLITYVDKHQTQISDQTISGLIYGKRNISPLTVEAAETIIEQRNRSAIPKINSGIIPKLKTIDLLIADIKLLLNNDTSIADDEIICYCDSYRKSDLDSIDLDPASFIFDVLLFTIVHTSNQDMNDHVKMVEKYYPHSKPTDFQKHTNTTGNDSEARKFIIEHENEIGYLPLCQIAFFLDPCKKNTRKIYTDYKLLPEPVQKKVLEYKRIPVMDLSEENWLGKSFNIFLCLIKEYNFSTVDIFYDSAKYVRAAYELYPDYPITDPNPSILHRIHPEIVPDFFPKREKLFCNLGEYIDAYVYYKNRNAEDDIIPPLNMIDKVINIRSCPGQTLSFWLCTFIVETCYMFAECELSIDCSCELETQEELFFNVVLQLYNLYKQPKTPFAESPFFPH